MTKHNVSLKIFNMYAVDQVSIKDIAYDYQIPEREVAQHITEGRKEHRRRQAIIAGSHHQLETIRHEQV